MPVDSSVAVDSAEVETVAVEEVRACFLAYESALVAGNVAQMNEWFIDDPRVIRFGIADEQWGAEAVRRWRRTAVPVAPGRALVDTDVVIWSEHVAVVTTLIRYPGTAELGRQSQTWIRIGGDWRIAHAHVSHRPEHP
jgi:1-carboxybiuret hydrolase subunit AtzH-like protein